MRFDTEEETRLYDWLQRQAGREIQGDEPTEVVIRIRVGATTKTLKQRGGPIGFDGRDVSDVHAAVLRRIRALDIDADDRVILELCDVYPKEDGGWVTVDRHEVSAEPDRMRDLHESMWKEVSESKGLDALAKAVVTMAHSSDEVARHAQQKLFDMADSFFKMKAEYGDEKLAAEIESVRNMAGIERWTELLSYVGPHLPQLLSQAIAEAGAYLRSTDAGAAEALSLARDCSKGLADAVEHTPSVVNDSAVLANLGRVVAALPPEQRMALAAMVGGP